MEVFYFEFRKRKNPPRRGNTEKPRNLSYDRLVRLIQLNWNINGDICNVQLAKEQLTKPSTSQARVYCMRFR